MGQGDGSTRDLGYDRDGDGTSDSEDSDMDGDGKPNSTDDDTDGDGIPNAQDEDDDDDGTADAKDNSPQGKLTNPNGRPCSCSSTAGGRSRCDDCNKMTEFFVMEGFKDWMNVPSNDFARYSDYAQREDVLEGIAQQFIGGNSVSVRTVTILGKDGLSTISGYQSGHVTIPLNSLRQSANTARQNII